MKFVFVREKPRVRDSVRALLTVQLKTRASNCEGRFQKADGAKPLAGPLSKHCYTVSPSSQLQGRLGKQKFKFNKKKWKFKKCSLFDGRRRELDGNPNTVTIGLG